MLDHKELEAFVAVAEELHFGRAAERLHMSQPPLSMRIRQLETRLQVTLFDRSTRSVRLTVEGERLLTPAKHALNELAKVEGVAKSLISGQLGELTIGFAGASSHRSLPRLTRAVRRAHPGIELKLRSQTYVYTANEMLLNNELDLAFSRLPNVHEELEHRIIEIERIVCALPEDHRLAAQSEIHMTMLAKEDFVSLPDNQGSILQATMQSLCVNAGFQPKVAQVAPDSATVLALVGAGAGLTITLSSTQSAQTTGVVYRPIVGATPEHMFATLAWRKDNTSPSLRRVLAVAEEALLTPDISQIQNNPFLIGIGLE